MTLEDFNHPPFACALAELPHRLGLAGTPPVSSTKPLANWRMEEDDAPILTYLYGQHQPRRHLEFGTWQGFGTCLCLEATSAKVWTINLPHGETKPDGSWAYSQRLAADDPAPALSEKKVFGSKETGPIVYHRTDADGFIGRFYRARGLESRVCQVYADSKEWNPSDYSADFFDSVLIDGGHDPDTVINDTRKALTVLRSGGLLLWHDFCPRAEIRTQFESVEGVTTGISRLLPELAGCMQTLCWINPSWILAGINK
jgi:predicted O-methyltransferase YrrM